MRTKGTRIGNGAGKGPGYGPGAGPSAPPFTTDNQPSPAAKSAGKEVAAQIKAQIAARKEEILAAQFHRALDPAHPQGHAAAKDLLDRIAPPESKTDVTSNGERLGYVIMAPAEAEDAEAWAKQHQPQA